MKSLLAILLLILCLPLAQAQNDAQAAGVVVTVTRVQQDQQAFFEIHARGFTRSSQQKAWQVLTDYDRLHEFVPNLLTSKLLERNGSQAVIEENGRFGFLFIRRTIHLVIRVTEHPFSALDIALVAGDMKHYATHWDLAPSSGNDTGGTYLSYTGRVEPDFFAPPLIGAAMLRTNVKRMMEAVIAEIDKAP